MTNSNAWLRKTEAQLRKKLVGKKITEVEYLSKEQSEHLGWDYSPLVLKLGDDILVYAMSDDEGNEAGALSLDFIQGGTYETVGVFRHESRPVR